MHKVISGPKVLLIQAGSDSASNDLTKSKATPPIKKTQMHIDFKNNFLTPTASHHFIAVQNPS